jgi:peptidase M15-like protein
MKLSEHFDLSEFSTGPEIPQECIPVFITLANDILEPMRTVAGKPLIITSGYRSLRTNQEAHGQPNSEHMATENWCAADVKIDIDDLPTRITATRALFDFARNSPTLPYHQLILETGPASIVLHCSYNKLKLGIRSVLFGEENNASPYVAYPHVAYAPPPTTDQNA